MHALADPSRLRTVSALAETSELCCADLGDLTSSLGLSKSTRSHHLRVLREAGVITTRYDIGFLAWFVGAATGLAVVRVAGAPVSVPVRVMAGVFAAGGIIVGKYVIFVHALNKALNVLSAGRAHSVGYLNTHAMSVFVHNFSSIVRPVYALWVALAFFAAVRTAGGRAIYTRRRR